MSQGNVFVVVVDVEVHPYLLRQPGHVLLVLLHLYAPQVVLLVVIVKIEAIERFDHNIIVVLIILLGWMIALRFVLFQRWLALVALRHGTAAVFAFLLVNHEYLQTI